MKIVIPYDKEGTLVLPSIDFKDVKIGLCFRRYMPLNVDDFRADLDDGYYLKIQSNLAFNDCGWKTPFEVTLQPNDQVYLTDTEDSINDYYWKRYGMYKAVEALTQQAVDIYQKEKDKHKGIFY